MALFGKKAPAPVTFPATLVSPATGEYVPMAELKDAAFASGKLGVCCGIIPSDGNIYAPVDGDICAPIDGVVSEVTDTSHALVITAGGMDILIHAGIHTVNMQGEGFKTAVKLDHVVKKGDLILQMDLWKVRNSGYDSTVIVAVSNSDDFAGVEAVAKAGKITTGDAILKVSK